MGDEALLGVCCVIGVGVPVCLLINGALLRGGCALYNRFAGKGSPERVPEPGLGHATGIVFVNLLASGAASFVVGLGAATLGSVSGVRGDRLELLIWLHAFPLGLIVLAALLAGMLPTTFARGLLAALCTLLLAVMIVAVLFLVFGALAVVAFLAK